MKETVENSSSETAIEQDHIGNAGQDSASNDLHEHQSSSGFEAKLEAMKTHLTVLKDVSFIMIHVYFLFGSISENTFYAFAVEFPVDIELLTPEEAAIGVTLEGISMIIGWVFVWIISHWNIDRHLLAIASLFLLGLSLIITSMSRSLPMIYASYIAFGFLEGCYVKNWIAWISLKFAHSQYFTIRVPSYVYFLVGGGSLLGPIAAGYFMKASHVKYTFYFLSSFPMVGSLVIFPSWI